MVTLHSGFWQWIVFASLFFSATILTKLEPITLIGVNLSVLLHAPCFWLLFYIDLSQGQCNARQRHKRMATPSILVTDCKYSFLLFATIYLLANPLRWAGAVQCYTSLDIILPFKMLPHWTLLRWAGPHQAKPVAPPPRSSLPLLPKLLSYTLPNLHFVFLPSVKALPRSVPSSPLGLFVKSFLLISFSLYLFYRWKPSNVRASSPYPYPASIISFSCCQPIAPASRSPSLCCCYLFSAQCIAMWQCIYKLRCTLQMLMLMQQHMSECS